MKMELKYIKKTKAEQIFASYRDGFEIYDDLKVEKYDGAVVLPERSKRFDGLKMGKVGGGGKRRIRKFCRIIERALWGI